MDFTKSLTHLTVTRATTPRSDQYNDNSSLKTVINTAEELEAFIGKKHYDAARTPGENVLKAIEGKFFPTGLNVTLKGCNFTLASDDKVEIPNNVTLEN